MPKSDSPAGTAEVNRQGRTRSVRARVGAVYLCLLAVNLGAWAYALFAFYGHPSSLGLGLVVYGLGLRHAVDADHVAAIDNVTRKLLQAGQHPVCVGFFFAAGHSAVILIVAVGVVGVQRLFRDLDAIRTLGGLLSTFASAGFLIGVAVMNVVTFVGLCKAYRRLRSDRALDMANLDIGASHGGPLTRILRPLFGVVSQSWHMAFLGFLFGLGFDTATEVAMYSVSAIQVAHGMSRGAMLVFPLLFGSAMMLVDTTDGVLMLGAYSWALARPARRIIYNLVITGISVLVAVLIASLEIVSLTGEALRVEGVFWSCVSVLEDHSNQIGLGIIALFLIAWAIAVFSYSASGRDKPPSIVKSDV